MKFRDMPKLPIVLLLVMLAAGAVIYPQLPERIPMHWGPSGQIDAWGAKSLLNVFFAPLVLAVLYLLLWFVPYLDPQRGNLIRSKQVYSIIIDLTAGLMAVVFFGQILAAQNHSLPMSTIIGVAVGVMFIVIGNYMGRVKRNWTMGVRFSWTLSDDVVWTKTNRLAGWLFMGSGVIAVLAALLLPPIVSLWFVVGPVLALIPITYVYSMRLYRSRHPEALEPPAPIPPAEEDQTSDAAGETGV